MDVTCDDSADCGNQLCCGSFDGSKYGGVSCQPVCVKPPFDSNPGAYVICGSPVGYCPAGQTCHPEPVLGPSYGYCF